MCMRPCAGDKWAGKSHECRRAGPSAPRLIEFAIFQLNRKFAVRLLPLLLVMRLFERPDFVLLLMMIHTHALTETL